MAHQTFFKSDQPTRVDRAVERYRQADAQERACKKAVDARDHRTCRCCGKRTNPDDIGLIRGHRHHIVYRSAGGQDTPENVVTLCWECHNDEHKGRLQVVVIEVALGAMGILEFWRKDEDGQWYLSKREIAVGRFEKD
jgi:hypothetical protein